MERLEILWEVHLKECEREWDSESGATRTRLGRQTWTVVLYVCSSSACVFKYPTYVLCMMPYAILCFRQDTRCRMCMMLLAKCLAKWCARGCRLHPMTEFPRERTALLFKARKYHNRDARGHSWVNAFLIHVFKQDVALPELDSFN